MAASGLSMYVGAAFAVILFASYPPAVVTWLRVGFASLVILALTRPRLKDFSNANALAYGVVTFCMNWAFYEAIARLPLGAAVSMEFVGPVAVAAWGSRSARDWASLVAAAVGVMVLGGTNWGASKSGVILILVSGAMWAGYIVASKRVSSKDAKPFTTMGVGFTYASALFSPILLVSWPVDADINVGTTIAVGLGLGIMSGVVPYGLDQISLKLASPAYFAVASAILPLTATLVGAVVLRQWLSPLELVGVALIVFAVASRRP